MNFSGFLRSKRFWCLKPPKNQPQVPSEKVLGAGSWKVVKQLITAMFDATEPIGPIELVGLRYLGFTSLADDSPRTSASVDGIYRNFNVVMERKHGWYGQIIRSDSKISETKHPLIIVHFFPLWKRHQHVQTLSSDCYLMFCWLNHVRSPSVCWWYKFLWNSAIYKTTGENRANHHLTDSVRFFISDFQIPSIPSPLRGDTRVGGQLGRVAARGWKLPGGEHSSGMVPAGNRAGWDFTIQRRSLQNKGKIYEFPIVSTCWNTKSWPVHRFSEFIELDLLKGKQSIFWVSLMGKSTGIPWIVHQV